MDINEEPPKRKIHLPICLEFPTFQIKLENRMKHILEVLPNGLIICNVKITNPLPDKNETVECAALIDTGSQITAICKSIYNKFSIDLSKEEKISILTLNGMESEAPYYPFKMNVPHNNWCSSFTRAVIKDFTDREKYEAIIGIDILRNFILHYDGIQGTAILYS